MKYHSIITSGDPAGIGIETILKHFNQVTCQLDYPNTTFTLVGTMSIFRYYAERLKIQIDFINNKNHLILKIGNFITNFTEVNGQFSPQKIGSIDKEAGRLAYQYLEIAGDAIDEFLERNIPEENIGLVTTPICKKSISLLHPDFIDHTHYLASRYQVDNFTMVFLSSIFNLLLLTIHIPISEVNRHITPQKIKNILDHAVEVQKLTKDNKPILFLGLNPHAGENGKIGKEDKIIKKAIDDYLITKKKKHPKLRITGPISPDTALLPIKEKKYQTVIACYHDQGLIPFKLLIHWNDQPGVQTTWGLPFVRTSVDHGTAFNISGKGIADFSPLSHAIKKNLELMKSKNKF